MSADALKQELRRAPRLQRGHHAEIHPYASGQVQRSPIQVTLQDLSPYGVGLIADHRMKLGDQFVMLLRNSSGEPMSLLYRVVRSEKYKESRFAIGAEFESLVEVDDTSVDGRPSGICRDSVND